MYKIALDVDDVLAAFYPEVCKRFGMPEVKTNIWDGKGTCKWIADKFPNLYYEKEFWENMGVLSNPLSITFDFECYITSIPDFLCEMRVEWLKRHGFPDKPVVCTNDNKLQRMKEEGIDILIDDNPSTIKEVREGGLIGIQFIPYYMSNYNERDPFSIRHLSEVNQIVEELNYVN